MDIKIDKKTLGFDIVALALLVGTIAWLVIKNSR